MQARVADQVTLHDVRRDHQVANVLSNHHQCSRQNGEDSKPFEAWGVEGRQREPVCLGNRCGIHNTHHEGECVTHEHADQYRDNRHKAAEQDGTENRHAQRHQRNNNGFRIR